MVPLLVLGSVLTVISVAAFTLKTIAEQAWRSTIVIYDEIPLAITGTKTWSFASFQHDFPIMSQVAISDGLTWTCLVISLTMALVSICIGCVVGTKKNILSNKIYRLFFHYTYLVTTVLCIATFGFLTHIHGQSEQVKEAKMVMDPNGQGGGRTYWSYPGLSSFDRETLGCGLGSSGRLVPREITASGIDSRLYANMLCVGETGTRSLLFMLGFTFAALGVWLEIDHYRKTRRSLKLEGEPVMNSVVP